MSAVALALPEIERCLREHIPISAAMGVRMIACDEHGVRLQAPLAANINHRATVFGGSASAVAIPAAWTFLHFTLRAEGSPSRSVIQRNSVDYLAPITGDFEASGQPVSPARSATFAATLRRYGKDRIELTAELTCGGVKVAAFAVDYMAVRLEKATDVAEL